MVQKEARHKIGAPGLSRAILLQISSLSIISLWLTVYFIEDLNLWDNVDSQRRLSAFENNGFRNAEEPAVNWVIWAAKIIHPQVESPGIQLALGLLFCLLYIQLMAKSSAKIFGVFLIFTPFFILQATNIQPFGIAAVLVLLGFFKIGVRRRAEGLFYFFLALFFHYSVFLLMMLHWVRSNFEKIWKVIFCVGLIGLALHINFPEFYQLVLAKVSVYQGVRDPGSQSGLIKHLLLTIAFFIFWVCRKAPSLVDRILTLFFLGVVLMTAVVSLKLSSRMLFLVDWWLVYLIFEKRVRMKMDVVRK